MARSHFGNPETGEIAPLGKNSSVFRTPNMARGTRGSSTRTIMRNIMPLNAIEVEMMSSKRRADTGVKDDTQACEQRANHGDTYA